jgi:methylmalonyl-CoA carboxyltransferase large subunit
MKTQTPNEFEKILTDIQAQLRLLTERVGRLEQGNAPAAAAAPAAPEAAAAVPAEPVVAPPEKETITEEELLAISAAIAAFLGVHARIRQIRLISTSAWAQQGRVSVQASHRLMH